MIPYGEISQTSIKCTLLRGFELELRLSLAKIPYLGEFGARRSTDEFGCRNGIVI
jgi:hypothetical protein